MREPCWYCGGSGQVECDFCFGPGYSDGCCPVCGGTGRHQCPECNGSGYVGEDDEDENNEEYEKEW